jgi:hypothetical protein
MKNSGGQLSRQAVRRPEPLAQDIHFKVSQSVYDAVHEGALREDLTPSHFCRRLLKDALARRQSAAQGMGGQHA